MIVSFMFALYLNSNQATKFQYCVNSGMCLCEVALKAAKRLDELENTIAAGGIQKGGGLRRK